MAEDDWGATGNAAQSILNYQLLVAAGMGDVAALRAALAAGADVETRMTGNGVTRTPLARVVNPSLTISDERRTACVRALLLAGASPSAPITSRGCCWMALHEAAYLGLYTVCRLLLDAGADVNVQSVDDCDNDTPLHCAAVLNSNQKVIALLLSRGAVDSPSVDRGGRRIRRLGRGLRAMRSSTAQLVASCTEVCPRAPRSSCPSHPCLGPVGLHWQSRKEQQPPRPPTPDKGNCLLLKNPMVTESATAPGRAGRSACRPRSAADPPSSPRGAELGLALAPHRADQGVSTRTTASVQVRFGGGSISEARRRNLRLVAAGSHVPTTGRICATRPAKKCIGDLRTRTGRR